MHETWLQPNKRVVFLGAIPPTIAVAIGAWLMVALMTNGHLLWATLLCCLLVPVSAVIACLVWSASRPRLAYSDGSLLVYLGTPSPFRVPIQLVECFFLGHGPSLMPAKEGKELETSTIVVRLAESAADWKHREVTPALGNWCDGYIVIRGTWCEPISADLVQRLNARLVEAHRKVKTERELKTA